MAISGGSSLGDNTLIGLLHVPCGGSDTMRRVIHIIIPPWIRHQGGGGGGI